MRSSQVKSKYQNTIVENWKWVVLAHKLGIHKIQAPCQLLDVISLSFYFLLMVLVLHALLLDALATELKCPGILEARFMHAGTIKSRTIKNRGFI